MKNMRYFVHIGYCGTNYKGWQRQPGVTTIQQVMEESLSNVLRNPTVCIGCGRTDAGVHAAQFFFHFDSQENLPKELLFKLNKVLPDDIAAFDVIPVEGIPHAQHSATLRTYEYYIHTKKIPALSSISSLYQLKFNYLDEVQRAVVLLKKYDNFTNFCRKPLRNESTICNIVASDFSSNASGDSFRFRITSKRFLQGMVRLIVQRLIDIATGELKVDDFEAFLSGERIPKKVRAAYPQGLHLIRVVYPFLDIPTIPFTFPNFNQ